MRVMVIIDHPYEESFNFALLDALKAGLAAAGHEADVLDLHKEDFDPVMRREELAVYSQGKFLDPKIGGYQQRIKQTDHLIFIFPVWWQVVPALLKGWIDKVFLPEWAFREADAAPLLTHLSGATAITTMGAPEFGYNVVTEMLLKGTLEFCGVTNTRYINFIDVSNVSPEQRAAWLAEVEQYGRALGEDANVI
ncbi:MAG: NAD(P)H-dependent oxidoreductase [Anaerolineae bacterium]|nr:NAD(P)H-dependent oxidoreductase [Anaerolineae bacterium]